MVIDLVPMDLVLVALKLQEDLALREEVVIKECLFLLHLLDREQV